MIPAVTLVFFSMFASHRVQRFLLLTLRVLLLSTRLFLIFLLLLAKLFRQWGGKGG